MYTSVSTAVFTSLPQACHHFDNGESYLRADYSVPCDYAGAYYAYAMVLVYPVGLPVLFAWLLFQQWYPDTR